MKKKEILLVIPAYNEAGNIERVVDNLMKNYKQYDYVIVNDGSKDRTSDICHINGYNIIDLPVNLGLAGAVQTGLQYAYQEGYEYAVQFDADGQHLPEYIEAMLRECKKDYDIIIASRFVTEKKPKSMRMLGSNLISLAIRLTTGVRIKDPTSGMRMYNRKMIEKYAYNINHGPEPDTVSYLVKQGAKVKEVQAKMEERIEGESYLNIVNSVKYMFRMMISIIFIQNFREKPKKINEVEK